MSNGESNQSNFKPAILVALVMLLLVAIVLIIPKTEPEQTEQPNESQTSETGPTETIDEEILVEVEGVALTGEEIGRDYCAKGMYLVPTDSDFPTVLMREMKDDGTLGIVDDSKYIDQEVIVTGLYTPLKAMCMALICDCEDFIVVNSIEVI